MKVLHIVSSLYRGAGGPARSVQGLVAELELEGVEAWLMAMKPLGDPWVPGVNHYINARCRTWRGMRRAVEAAIDEVKPDIVHIHSIWQWTLHLAVKAAQNKNVPYIMTPRGTIEKWSLRQKWFKKRVARFLYQDSDFRKCAAIHVTAESERDQAIALGYNRPLIVSPNGVNIPENLPPLCRHQDGFRRLLFMSRFHYKKGLMNLIDAWEKVRAPGWKVELVGTDSAGYLKVVKEHISELGLDNDFIITGPLMDECKWEAYRRADAFVLPSYSENFGIVVAEALWSGLPVITTKGTPWEELIPNKCGMWIDIGVDPLADALREIVSISDQEREMMGERGHYLVESKYTWSAVCKPLIKAYQEIVK